MIEKDHEMRERYIYQVIRRIPKNLRDEVRMELKDYIYGTFRSNISVYTGVNGSLYFG